MESPRCPVATWCRGYRLLLPATARRAPAGMPSWRSSPPCFPGEQGCASVMSGAARHASSWEVLLTGSQHACDADGLSGGLPTARQHRHACIGSGADLSTAARWYVSGCNRCLHTPCIPNLFAFLAKLPAKYRCALEAQCVLLQGPLDWWNAWVMTSFQRHASRCGKPFVSQTEPRYTCNILPVSAALGKHHHSCVSIARLSRGPSNSTLLFSRLGVSPFTILLPSSM